ncbi:hypothetical protein B5807_01724 [Epicoccum nigrum]|uniref:Methyltransferase type 12 domain-containing protein n=1 Tax=Epicoccum nigrum TaxID=105696 RepID=A0A1Y2MDT7_EPING|nr:hypothetical protein B5807_01724 [Epicoccum nigrum]
MASSAEEGGATERFQTDNSVSAKQMPKQQLSKAMEHMRFAVTVDPKPTPSSTSTSTPTPTPTPATDASPAEPAEEDAYGVPATIQPVRNPASRSHDPSNNQKRTDPFSFGSRVLEEGDNIFEFNAWDNVIVDDSYKTFSEEQFSKQRADPVSDFDRKRFNDHPEKWWNVFYKNNKTNFFKNRKWLSQEFPVLGEIGAEDAPAATVLEVGAGAGNSAFPILQNSRNPRLKIHACDFSKKAVELIRAHDLYDETKIQADVWDVAASPDGDNGGLPPGLAEGTVDVVLLIFIFSALNPRQWDQAVRNVWRLLKPGGQVLFRDYGRGDLAQVRFKKGRWMEENFYVRGDGTRVYFFEQDELRHIWGGDAAVEGKGGKKEEEEEEGTEKEHDGHDDDASLAQQAQNLAVVVDGANGNANANGNGHLAAHHTPPHHAGPRPAFDVAHFGVDRRMLVNRQRRLKMYRCWMQAVFRKPGSDVGVQSNVPTSTLRQETKQEEEEVGQEGEGEGEA